MCKLTATTEIHCRCNSTLLLFVKSQLYTGCVPYQCPAVQLIFMVVTRSDVTLSMVAAISLTWQHRLFFDTVTSLRGSPEITSVECRGTLRSCPNRDV